MNRYISYEVGSIVSVPIEPESGPIINVDKDIHIDLYTLTNPNEPQHLVVHDKSSIADSNYNRKVPTRIFIHGFGNGRVFINSFADGKPIYCYLIWNNNTSLASPDSLFGQSPAWCQFDCHQLVKNIEYFELY